MQSNQREHKTLQILNQVVKGPQSFWVPAEENSKVDFSLQSKCFNIQHKSLQNWSKLLSVK